MGYGGDLNLYAYASSDPLGARDPKGTDDNDDRMCGSRIRADNATNSASCTTVIFSGPENEKPKRKSALQVIRENISAQGGIGPQLGLRGEFFGAKLGLEFFALSQNYEISGSLEDQGTFEAVGPGFTAQVGKIGFDYRTDTVTQIIDEDLGPTRSWREEISDGEFIYEIRNGELEPVGPDFGGGIYFDVRPGAFRIEIKVDIFKMIYELTNE